ncbi:MAG: hypothetical protein HQL79_09955 [Magnetococcales bacterium]|nr:hypothetical protein [Magnetococcales bacterium]
MNPPIDVTGQVQDIDLIEDYYRQSRHCLESRKNVVLGTLGSAELGNVLSAMDLETVRFASPDEICKFFNGLVDELENLVTFDYLSITEGHIRYDFATRINNRDPHPITSCFVNLLAKSRYGAGGVELKKILDVWIQQHPGDTDMENKISMYKAALELRHWLAHGRWWNLRSGHTVSNIQQIVDDVLRTMGLRG